MSTEDELSEQEQQALLNEMFTAESVDTVKLDDFGIKAAARVANVIDRKGPDGEFIYSNREVRDFFCACIMEIGVPMTRELEAVVYNFLDDVDLGDDDSEDAPMPTEKEFILAVRKYFDENPLHPTLAAEFADMARDEGRRAEEGFKNDQAARNIARATAGLKKEPTRAPSLESSTPGKPTPKIKKGLS